MALAGLFLFWWAALSPIASQPGPFVVAPAHALAAPQGSALVAQGAAALRASPLQFEENLGQADAATRFIAHAPGYLLLLQDDGMQVVPADSPAFGLRFGGTAHASARGEAPSGGSSSYLHGAASDWVHGARHFAKVRYEGAFPGIDLLFYGNERGQPEFDVLVQPGVDASQAEFVPVGVDAVSVHDGRLQLGASFGLAMPAVYAEEQGMRTPVAAAFAVGADHHVRFTTAAHDPLLPLIIDPVLQYATLYGGSGEDQVYGAVADAAGNTYVVGQTASTQASLSGANPASPPQPGFAGGTYDAFVAKISHSGATPTVAWRAYLGGNTGGVSPNIGDDRARAVCIDGAGNVVVAGVTQSTNFPLLNPIQAANGALNAATGAPWDGFLARLSPSGTLLSSTYLGGDQMDYVHGMACDATGIYLVGSTYSSNLPGASGSPIQGQCARTFTATLTSGSSTLTAFGGTPTFTSADVGRGVHGYGVPAGTAIAALNSATSLTMSAPALVSTTFTETIGRAAAGTTTSGSTTVTSAAPLFTAADVGTLLNAVNPSTSATTANAIITAVNSATSATIAVAATGSGSMDLLLGTVCSSFSNQEGFVLKVNPSATAVLWSTNLGGGSIDRATGIVATASAVYVTGLSNSAASATTMGLPGTAFRTGTATITAGSSAIAAGSLTFSAADVGRAICGSIGMPIGTTLVTVPGPGATLSAPATSSGTFSFQIGGSSPIQGCHHGGTTDAFLAKLNNPTTSAGLALQWTTYLGGTSTEYDSLLGGSSQTFQSTGTSTDAGLAPTVVLGSNGNPVVFGTTCSSDFPTTAGAFRTTSIGCYDATLTQVAASGTALLASTYLGSTSSDYARGAVQVEPVTGNLWVPVYTFTSTWTGRTFAAGTTNGLATLSAATPTFYATDVGRTVTGAGIPFGTAILAVTSPTTATLSNMATATGTAALALSSTPPDALDPNWHYLALAKMSPDLKDMPYLTFLGGSDFSNRILASALDGNGILSLAGSAALSTSSFVAGPGGTAAGFPMPQLPNSLPAPFGARVVRDGQSTAGTATVTSASAAFTSADVGRSIQTNYGYFATNTYITNYNSPTSVTISTPSCCTSSPSSPQTFTIGQPIMRRVADGVATGTTTVTSASATFSSSDVGRTFLVGPPGAPTLTTSVSSVLGTTQAILASAVPSGSGLTFTIAAPTNAVADALLTRIDTRQGVSVTAPMTAICANQPMILSLTLPTGLTPIPTRSFTDGSTVALGNTLTSTTGLALFTAADLGLLVSSNFGVIPQGTVITAILSPTQATMSNAASSTFSGQTITVNPWWTTVSGLTPTIQATAPYSVTAPRVSWSSGPFTNVLALRVPFTDGSVAVNRITVSSLASGLNSLGQACAAAGSATLTMPYASTASPVRVCVNEPVTFAAAGLWWQFPVNTYTFTFGDGTQQGPLPLATASHTYTTAATGLQVTLRAEYNNGPTFSTDAVTRTLDVVAIGTNSNGFTCQPTNSAVLTMPYGSAASPVRVCANEPLTFGGTGTWAGSPIHPTLGYRWDFGDATGIGPAAEPTASHTYTAAATGLNVRFTVQYANLMADTKTRLIDVLTTGTNSNGKDCAPTVTLTPPVGTLCPINLYTFSATVGSNYFAATTGYAWADGLNFVPGTASTVLSFGGPGLRTIALRVSFAVGPPATRTVNLPVIAGCGLPVAASDCYGASGGIEILAPGVLANDHAFGNGFAPTSAVLATAPQHAAAFTFRPDGSFNYVPAPGFGGDDAFSYTAVDGPYRSAPATVCLRSAGASAGLPPSPAFTTATTPVAGVAVTFFDTSVDRDGMVVESNWDFGNGTVATGRSVAHTFPSAGTFWVRLRVRDDVANERSLTLPVIVQPAPLGPPSVPVAAEPSPLPPPPAVPPPPPPPPPATDNTGGNGDTVLQGFTARAADPAGGLIVFFQAAETQGRDYQWEFGDGATATGLAGTHAYGKAGDYTVRLTFTDAKGVSHSAVQTVRATAAPDASRGQTVIQTPASALPPGGWFGLGAALSALVVGVGAFVWFRLRGRKPPSMR